MSSVSLKSIVKKFDRVLAVDNISLEIEDKEFLILVGPSGCGKSTTLRMIAGLEEITEGEIYIAGKLVNALEPKDRDIAMVFQSYALYPHMSVYANMAFGLRMRKFPKDEIDRRVQHASRILQIGELLHRKPRQLSGGQRQRVAVGRAIVREPAVFLFDEPLSNLDAKLRVEMRSELVKLHDQLHATMVYVTHDQSEAMSMGDRIVVMKDGVIQQVGTPLDVYDRPVNKFVAGFIGSPTMNFFPGKLVSEQAGFVLELPGLRLNVPPQLQERYRSHVGRDVIFGIRPEDIHDQPPDTAGGSYEKLSAMVEVYEHFGSTVSLLLSRESLEFKATVGPATVARAHQMAELYFDMKRFQLFDAVDEKVLGVS